MWKVLCKFCERLKRVLVSSVNTATIKIAESGIVGHTMIEKCRISQLQGEVTKTWNKCKGIKRLNRNIAKYFYRCL